MNSGNAKMHTLCNLICCCYAIMLCIKFCLKHNTGVEKSRMISVPLRMSCPVIDLCASQERKMERERTWHKLQEDKHNFNNQNKAWSFWHITLTFFTDTCSNLIFAQFLLFFGQRGSWKRSQVVTGGNDILTHSGFFLVISEDKSQSFIWDIHSQVTAETWSREVQEVLVQAPFCHHPTRCPCKSCSAELRNNDDYIEKCGSLRPSPALHSLAKFELMNVHWWRRSLVNNTE